MVSSEHHQWEKLKLHTTWIEALRTEHHFCSIPSEDAQPKTNDDETVKSKWKNILQNNTPIIFRSVKVMKVDEIEQGTIPEINRRDMSTKGNANPETHPFALMEIIGETWMGTAD